MRRLLTISFRAAALPAGGLLAACGPTEYERAGGGPGETGYTTSRLAEDRYLVTFEGNAQTPRETVETYLLYRAAEVAAETGHPYFALVAQATEREVDYNVYAARPGLHGLGPGFGGVGPAYGYPYYATWGYGGLPPTVTTTDAFEAYATVAMLESRDTAREDVFETEAVLAGLRPLVEFPES
jgi:hypothetical protein